MQGRTAWQRGIASQGGKYRNFAVRIYGKIIVVNIALKTKTQANLQLRR